MSCLHRWKTQDVSWERKDPADSPSCYVSAYCEKCSREVVFEFERTDVQSPNGKNAEDAAELLAW